MEATDEQALISALTAERPPPAGWYWQLSPHPELTGWYWASKAHPTELPAPGGALLCGPNGRRLTMLSIPGMRGDSPVAVSVLRELGASDLSDNELTSEIYAREQGGLSRLSGSPTMLLQLGGHPENDIDPRLVAAVAAARRGAADAFRQEVKVLDKLGWDEVEGPAGAAFVAALTARLGDTPNVGDIVNLSQAVHPKTRAVLNASVYDIEFLIRGQAGAAPLARTFPRNVAVAMQLAVIGALTDADPVALGLPAFDRS